MGRAEANEIVEFSGLEDSFGSGFLHDIFDGLADKVGYFRSVGIRICRRSGKSRLGTLRLFYLLCR